LYRHRVLPPVLHIKSMKHHFNALTADEPSFFRYSMSG
jgi:hypothetical protein